MTKRTILLLIPLAMGACELPLGSCDSISLPGITVTVLDSVTGTPAAGEAITVIATDGVDADTIRYDSQIPNPAGRVFLVYENPGSYQVRVEVTGYRPWMRDNVRVTRSRCHVETVELVARLQRI